MTSIKRMTHAAGRNWWNIMMCSIFVIVLTSIAYPSTLDVRKGFTKHSDASLEMIALVLNTSGACVGVVNNSRAVFQCSTVHWKYNRHTQYEPRELSQFGSAIIELLDNTDKDKHAALCPRSGVLIPNVPVITIILKGDTLRGEGTKVVVAGTSIKPLCNNLITPALDADLVNKLLNQL